MKAEEKTKDQLLREIRVLQEQITELEKSESERRKLEKALEQSRKELEIQSRELKEANESIKLLCADLEEKNKEFQKLDQLKSDFISTVSHELRTPLSITKEGVCLVLDKILGEINEKQEKILTTARDNIDRLTRVINNMLNISKMEQKR